MISMSSRGRYIFFRTQNRVIYRKTRYRLTAINFEAALYGCDGDQCERDCGRPTALSGIQQQALQGMAALLTRIQGTDASVSLTGNAVSSIPGTEFVMPAPTAAAVTGYGGGGGAIAAAAGTGAAKGGAPNEVAEVVTETALTRLETTLVDPRLVGAPYPPSSVKAPRGAKEHVGTPMARSTAMAWTMVNCQLARWMQSKRGSNG